MPHHNIRLTFLQHEIHSDVNQMTQDLPEDDIIAIVRKLSELYERYPQYTTEYFERVGAVQQLFMVGCLDI